MRLEPAEQVCHVTRDCGKIVRVRYRTEIHLGAGVRGFGVQFRSSSPGPGWPRLR